MGRLTRDVREGARRRSSGIAAMSPFSIVFLVVVAVNTTGAAPFFSKGGSTSGSYGMSMMKPYKPSYTKMNYQPSKPSYKKMSPKFEFPDFGMILKKVIMAKKGIVNKILAPIIGIKKRTFRDKEEVDNSLDQTNFG